MINLTMEIEKFDSASINLGYTYKQRRRRRLEAEPYKFYILYEPNSKDLSNFGITV